MSTHHFFAHELALLSPTLAILWRLYTVQSLTYGAPEIFEGDSSIQPATPLAYKFVLIYVIVGMLFDMFRLATE